MRGREEAVIAAAAFAALVLRLNAVLIVLVALGTGALLAWAGILALGWA